MMTPSDLTQDWREYKSWVTNLATEGGSFFCRGQAQDNWRLSTSFHRLSNKITLEHYLREVVPAVHEDVSALIDSSFEMSKNDDLNAFLALLQHHSFPTPLLDWTLSPYIAAYFAFREVADSRHATEYVKIYVFDYGSWSRSFEQSLVIDGEAPHVSVVRPRARLNARLMPQQGTFVSTNTQDVEAHVRACEKSANQTFLWTIRMPVKQRDVVLRDLKMMGIDESAMFPGLDGLCRGLHRRLLGGNVGETAPEVFRRSFPIQGAGRLGSP